MFKRNIDVISINFFYLLNCRMSNSRKKQKVEVKHETKEDNVVVNDQDVSDYEKVRFDNIKRNEEFLSTLGLEAEKSVMNISRTSSSATKRGFTPKTKIVLPSRRSSRVTVERVKSELDELKSKGGDNESITIKERELAELMAMKFEGSYEASLSTDPIVASYADNITRHSSDPISLLRPKNINNETGTENIEIVNILNEITPNTKNEKISNDLQLYTNLLNKLTVAEKDVAKLTENRVTSVYCLPTADKLIVIAGDKAGYLGIWDVDSPVTGHGGVYRYRPHTETVIKLHSYSHEPSKLFSVSYDGTIRSIDLNHTAFTYVFEAPESVNDISYTDASFDNNNLNRVIIGTSHGTVNQIDFRQNNKYVSKIEIANSKLNSIQIHPHQEHILIATAGGKDGCTTIHDLRKLSNKPLFTINQHDKSVNAAYVTPNGNYLVSVSQDNTIKIFKDYLTNKPIMKSIRHDNHTGKIIFIYHKTFNI